jgi:hypothetical protein
MGINENKFVLMGDEAIGQMKYRTLELDNEIYWQFFLTAFDLSLKVR